LANWALDKQSGDVAGWLQPHYPQVFSGMNFVDAVDTLQSWSYVQVLKGNVEAEKVINCPASLKE